MLENHSKSGISPTSTCHQSIDWWFLTYCNKAKKKPTHILQLGKARKPDIIVAHNPPYGYVDQLGGRFAPKKLHGKHVGSHLLLKVIKTYEPRIVICSHIHEAKGIAHIGKTTVVNCGLEGSYAIIDINRDKVEVKLH